MAEYALDYTGQEIDRLLSLVDNNSFAANDIIVVSEVEPTSETCLIWIRPNIDTKFDITFDIWFRI